MVMTELSELLSSFELGDNGYTETGLQGIRLFKGSQHIPRKPLVYEPGICIVAQGRKVGYLAGEVFHYDADNYLVTTVTMPFECETFASPEEPLLGIYIDVNMELLHSIIGQLGVHAPMNGNNRETLHRGIGPALLDPEMKNGVNRLVKCLQSEAETQIIGPGLVKEILFRALCGAQASVLYSLAAQHGNFAQISRALRVMQSSFAEKLDVEHLANIANMSSSTFHKAFKEVTSESPLQYLKKLRLNKARYLMIQESTKAYIAAFEVGYESPSQFSREFKRYFGHSPAEAIRDARPN
jgi:AraC-like DNA-binding protein